MPPEVFGAVSLAIRTVNRIARLSLTRPGERRKRKVFDKLARHIARAERYQAKRETA